MRGVALLRPSFTLLVFLDSSTFVSGFVSALSFGSNWRGSERELTRFGVELPHLYISCETVLVDQYMAYFLYISTQHEWFS